MAADRESTKGVVCALAAFSFWGLIPAFYKKLEHVPAAEIVAHRIVWTVVLSLFLLLVFGRFRVFVSIWRTPKKVGWLFLSGALISSNWLVFLWAVTHGQVLETSMGYFIAPLMHVFLGVTFLGERPRKAQALALALACAGVSYLVVQQGAAPWIAIGLPITFGLYALLRKQVEVDALGGLATEMVLVLPAGLAYVVYAGLGQTGHFGAAHGIDSVYLVLNAPVTVFPLTMFAMAARRLRLTTLGVLQYVGPTLTFLLAVFVFGETFDRVRLVAFVCIWASLLIYTYEGVRFNRLSAPRVDVQPAVE